VQVWQGRASAPVPIWPGGKEAATQKGTHPTQGKTHQCAPATRGAVRSKGTSPAKLGCQPARGTQGVTQAVLKWY
jgi:hypothetical protein